MWCVAPCGERAVVYDGMRWRAVACDGRAVAVPNTLVHRVSQKLDGTYDQYLQEKVDKAQKIVLLLPELTWLIFGINKTIVKTVFEGQIDNTDIDEEIDNLHVDMKYKNSFYERNVKHMYRWTH